jgi:mono/diheme cytochrome c family protein
MLAMTMTSLLALLAASTARGQGAAKKLNSHTGNPQAIEEGRALYIQHGCSGCHGVRGGGGMALPLNDDRWEFGSGDEVLFKLIKGEIPESTMPRIENLADDQVWKLLAYIRSLYTGDPALADW